MVEVAGWSLDQWESDEVRVADCMLKARPSTEGDRRILYIEPSNEQRDAHGEVIEQEALRKSADYFAKFGNIDLHHYSMIGPRVLKLDPVEAKSYEIGLPIDVRRESPIMVKAEIYQGEGRMVEKANFFWDSITKVSPAVRWYPSVAGVYLDRRPSDEGTIVKAVNWSNIGFDQRPVNQAVKAVSLMPLSEFWKAVTAGYGTDVAQLSGGQAVQLQSLDRRPAYAAAAAKYMRTVGTDRCEHTRGTPTLAKLVAHFRDCESMDDSHARAAAARLLRQVAQRVKQTNPAAEAA